MSADKNIELIVSEHCDNLRLDLAIVECLAEAGFESLNTIKPTRSKISKWISAGDIFLNGKQCEKPSLKVKFGDLISLPLPAVKPLELVAQSEIKIDLVFEDEEILVINKPAFIPVHPGAGHPDSTLLNGVIAHLGKSPKVGDPQRPGVVHRLDKDTSGLLVIAKTDLAYQSLVSQFIPPRTITRTYLALVAKSPAGANKGIIDKSIGRDPKNRIRMACVKNTKPAQTEWRLIRNFTNFGSEIEAVLHTGRTHQIRVHFASENAPLLGDKLYGISYGNLEKAKKDAIARLGRQALHAQKLSFIHPAKKQEVEFVSEPPDDILNLISVLES